ncbi:TetR/AcrR family transcriptional regulator [Microbacterium sp.]|uniref:TetR/AcrR family transcriptional regulator n=1 Tax=Microbacterium sp. TaxID=51671 RepID=UPI0039E29415
MSGRGRGRPRETTHEQIRDAARTLFLRQGYAATSLQQIADAVGISRTTLFHYFPAKRDLMSDEVDASVDRVRAALAASEGLGVVAALAAAIVAALGYTRAEHDALALRWRIARSDDELRAVIRARTDDAVELLRDYARRRSPGTDEEVVRDVVEALLAVSSSASIRWSDRERPTDDLDDYVAARLAPFAEAMSRMIP